jgi:hypothetical protein
MFWSIGSSVLIVLDKGLDLTTQTSTLPRQTPALKNVVCDDILFARFKPDRGSIGSRASSGNVMTWRSVGKGKIEVMIDMLHINNTTYLIAQ